MKAFVGVEADLAERGDADHVVDPPVPGSGESVRVLSQEEASRAAVPVQEVNRYRSANRATSPALALHTGGNHWSDAADVDESRAAGQHEGLELGGGHLALRLDRPPRPARHSRTPRPQGDPLYGIRALLRAGAEKLTDRQRSRLHTAVAPHENDLAVHLAWSCAR